MKHDKVGTFERKPKMGEPLQHLAFSGRGFVPDLSSEHGLATMPEASRTTLEQDHVHGSEGMLPAPGVRQKIGPGQVDSGNGGAGSFATVAAHQARG